MNNQPQAEWVNICHNCGLPSPEGEHSNPMMCINALREVNREMERVLRRFLSEAKNEQSRPSAEG